VQVLLGVETTPSRIGKRHGSRLLRTQPVRRDDISTKLARVAALALVPSLSTEVAFRRA
jgi:hypothetical protein